MIQRMLLTAETVHAVLVSECGSIVKSFRDDLLVHDLHHLKRCPDGTPFLHFSRESGTYMVMLIAADEYPAKGEIVPYLFGHAGREHCLDGVWDIVDSCTKDGRHVCHYYDGKALRHVPANKARVIASEYADIIRKQWASGVSAPAPVGAYLGLGM
jgi:hypothetical protein